MQCRHEMLESTLVGLEKTGVPLVASVSTDGPLSMAGATDDIGIYYFIPSLAHLFGIPIDAAIHLFFKSLLVFATLISMTCFWFQFPKWASRCVSVTSLSLLGYVAYRANDVYLAFYVAVAAVVPFILGKVTLPRLAFAGLIAGYCNFIRMHSGTGVLLFVVCWILWNASIAKRAKLWSLLTVALFVSLPYLHFYKLEKAR
ncbi:MAG: hypothetical protein KGQ49_00815, partial [Verrucomicrobia bacterium]|nr:hypothetical protein [Verrucomicrobiota bacterium]